MTTVTTTTRVPSADVLQARAEQQEHETQTRERLWEKGFTRRRLLAGGMGVGVATLGSQLVTTRVAYGAPSAAATGCLVVIFLRGGLDGLSLLVPGTDPDYLAARGSIAVPASRLVAMDRGFGLHPAMAPLAPLVAAGKVAAVPAVSTPDLSRSHFQAQDCLERGGSATGAQTGWLDRVLEQTGPGTTFRAVALGGLSPRSLAGDGTAMTVGSISSLSVPSATDPQWRGRTLDAVRRLYTGVDDPVSLQAALACDAVTTAASMSSLTSSTTYPAGDFASALKDIARIIRSGAGARVACVDLGGWDMHTGIGTLDWGDMVRQVGALASALAAFITDLGPLLDTTTVVTMSEFGRRVQKNASGGADHGHGGVSLVLGGGVSGGVKGRWLGLAPSVLDQGDVPGTNDYRDVLGEVVGRRLGLSDGQLATVFPGWSRTPLGVMA